VTKGDLHAEEDSDRPEDGGPETGDGRQIDSESEREHEKGYHGEGEDDAKDVAHPTLDA
jgi:hypothetical protein